MAESLEEAAERLVGDAVRQGFPRVCSDASVIAKIAAILADGNEHTPRKKSRRGLYTTATQEARHATRAT